MSDASGSHGILSDLLAKVGLRGLMYNLGGRKVVAGGGALGVITLIVQSDMADWPKAIACIAAALVAAAISLGIGMEDKKPKA